MRAWAGLLASGSSYSPRLPGSSPVASAGFVPGYSDGVAADSHRLPWALMGTLGANNEQTLSEDRQPPQYDRVAAHSSFLPRLVTRSRNVEISRFRKSTSAGKTPPAEAR